MSLTQVPLGPRLHPSQISRYERRVVVRLVIVASLLVFFHMGLWLHLPLFGVTAESLLLASVLAGVLLGSIWGAGAGFALGGVHDLLSPTPLGLGCFSFAVMGYAMARLSGAVGITKWWQSGLYGALGIAAGIALYASVGELLGQEFLITQEFPRIFWAQILFALLLSPGMWLALAWVANAYNEGKLASKNRGIGKSGMSSSGATRRIGL